MNSVIQFVKKDFEGSNFLLRSLGFVILVIVICILLFKFVLKREFMDNVVPMEDGNVDCGNNNILQDGLNDDSGEIRTKYISGEDLTASFYTPTPFNVNGDIETLL